MALEEEVRQAGEGSEMEDGRRHQEVQSSDRAAFCQGGHTRAARVCVCVCHSHVLICHIHVANGAGQI